MVGTGHQRVNGDQAYHRGPARGPAPGGVSRETYGRGRRGESPLAARRRRAVVVTVGVIIAVSALVSNVTALVVAAAALWRAFHHTHGPPQ